jgi:SAM-dependent methyltransferase
VFDEQSWEERYRGQTAVWSGRPNPQLVAEAADLPVGSALEAGSGEGADALWLASRGWQVMAVDFSTTALQRAAEHARAADVAERIQWKHADLTTWPPPEGQFDLVTAHYLQLPTEIRRPLYDRLAAAVAPGGTLLLVGHDTSDLGTTAHRPHVPDMFFTAEEVAAALGPDRWEVVVAEARPRSHADPEGREITVHDAVLRARRTA